MIYLHDDGKQYRLRRGRFIAPRGGGAPFCRAVRRQYLIHLSVAFANKVFYGTRVSYGSVGISSLIRASLASSGPSWNRCARGKSFRKNEIAMAATQTTRTVRNPCWIATASESLSASNTWLSMCCTCCMACAATAVTTWSCSGPGGICATAFVTANRSAVRTTVS